MARDKALYTCQNCGYETASWYGKCPNCDSWNTLVEEVRTSHAASSSSAKGRGRALLRSLEKDSPADARGRLVPLQSIALLEPDAAQQRLTTGLPEFDRVLGGGVVPGSVVLIGGSPGIGKSTLLLQAAASLSHQGTVLYISGEESLRQTGMRAQRLGIDPLQLLLATETDLADITELVAEASPDILIIDSIQTLCHPDVSSAPGSVAQVRESTGFLMRLSKEQNIATFLVGHVTKENRLAGPRTMEHIVDTVIYFEGDGYHNHRSLRAVKNRFGSTNELGLFQMTDSGLAEVQNPSLQFLSERVPGVPGSAVTAAVEGTRPLLIEVQALVAPTSFRLPRRTASGIDVNRLSLLIAVLQQKVGLGELASHDVYLKVAGGLRIQEPAADLAVALAVASSLKDTPIPQDLLAFGEVGLTGELRQVGLGASRLREAEKLGFDRVVLPYSGSQALGPTEGLDIVPIKTLAQAVASILEYS